jgi:hypothetical protein
MLLCADEADASMKLKRALATACVGITVFLVMTKSRMLEPLAFDEYCRLILLLSLGI